MGAHIVGERLENHYCSQEITTVVMHAQDGPVKTIQDRVSRQIRRVKKKRKVKVVVLGITKKKKRVSE